MLNPVWWHLASSSERCHFKNRSIIPQRFKVLKCAVCIGSFIPERQNQKCCTEQCQKENTKELGRLASKKYRQSDKRAKWESENRDLIRESKKRYYKSAKGQAASKKQSKRANSKKSRDEIVSYARQWRDKNREMIRERDSKYQNHRYKTDSQYRLVPCVRNRIRKSLKAANQPKSQKTIDLLGCSGSRFMEYLLEHPARRPEWDEKNYGVEWVVDHIRPISSFDLSIQSELKKAFHYANCQPMDPNENLIKGSFYRGKYHSREDRYEVVQ